MGDSVFLAFRRTTSCVVVYNFVDVVGRKPKPAPPPLALPAFEGKEIYLKDWRKKLRKSQEWVAAQIGSDKGTLSEIENKEGAEGVKTRSRWIYAYASALGLSIEQLLRHPDAQPSLPELVDRASPRLQQIVRDLIEHDSTRQ